MSTDPRLRQAGAARQTDGYKWVALSNTTVGVLLATIDATIMLIAMPVIFRGIGLNPLAPGNSFFLLWMILGFLIVSSVLVVNLGRLGDLFGRVRMYNLGFVVYTIASLLLTIDWMTGADGAIWLIGFRIVQGIGAAFLIANSAAILTDAFPPNLQIGFRIVQGIGAAFLIANSAAILTDAFPSNQRGLALGINNVAGISGSFIGLVLGGLLAPINWRLVFLISVPFGLFGTVWSYLKLQERGIRKRAPIDWTGNLTFALGLVLVMIGITYGIEPYGGNSMGWTSPWVLAELATGVALLIAFALIETRTANPMFRLPLFRIRAYTFGVMSSFLAAVARGGLMFMLIIWLQGIWLPEHGYSFETTPLWAGIFMLPLSVGFLLAGPVSGYLSDRFGARPFATGGMIGAAISFVFLDLLPVSFSYPVFALILLINGLSMGAFAAPNRAGIMNSLPAQHRGAGGGLSATFQSSAQVLSIGIFFTLMILGLSTVLRTTLTSGLEAHGVPGALAVQVGNLPPVSILFATFLGYNPVQQLIGPGVLSHLSAANAATLTGRQYFPHLIAGPFQAGLHEAFAFSIVACLVAALASWFRGGRYVAGAPSAVAADPDVGSLVSP